MELRAMLIGYVYKLNPSLSQAALMERHIEMLRLQYVRRVSRAFQVV